MAQGNVEVWLGSLLNASLQALNVVIKQASVAVNDPNFELMEFQNSFPAQVTDTIYIKIQYYDLIVKVGILGIQFIWTRDAEIALSQARSDKKIMAATNDHFLEMLNALISMTTQELKKIDRVKYETLVLIHLHQRDIFDDLVRIEQHLMDQTNVQLLCV